MDDPGNLGLNLLRSTGDLSLRSGIIIIISSGIIIIISGIITISFRYYCNLFLYSHLISLLRATVSSESWVFVIDNNNVDDDALIIGS